MLQDPNRPKIVTLDSPDLQIIPRQGVKHPINPKSASSSVQGQNTLKQSAEHNKKVTDHSR